jgi:hypothetical protein
LTHEGPLIEALGCGWNKTGFGNHDPGRERDTTKLKANHFDRLYPINPDIALVVAPGRTTVWNALSAMRTSLPYLFRFESTHKSKPRGSHPLYLERSVDVTAKETATSLAGKIVDALGSEWQVSFLHGYLILYRENRSYSAESALKIKRGGTDWL